MTCFGGEARKRTSPLDSIALTFFVSVPPSRSPISIDFFPLTPLLPLYYPPPRPLQKTLQSVKNNGTLFLHVVVGLTGHPLDASLEGYEASKVFNKTFAAVAFHPRPKRKGGVNLLGGSTTGGEIGEEEQEGLSSKKNNSTASSASERKKSAVEETEEEASPVGGGWGGSGAKKARKGGDDGKEAPSSKQQPPREIISFLKPNLTVAMIDDFQAYARGKIPEQVRGRCSFFWVLRLKGEKGGVFCAPPAPLERPSLSAPLFALFFSLSFFTQLAPLLSSL